MFEHKHPLDLIDMWLEQLQKEDEEEDEHELIETQDLGCLCFRCQEKIKWFHRYYYSCLQCNDYFIHKFCAELPERLEDVCEVGHTLDFYIADYAWWCDICGTLRKPRELCYRCSQCNFHIDAKCATKRLQKDIIYHPSHKHPLVCIPKQILCECDACGKEHKGIFYNGLICTRSSFIHSDCAFLPTRLLIQDTHGGFSHVHPLTLAYSFPKMDQESKFYPPCRVCDRSFYNPNLWIYKCEKCRYYTHLDCATSRNEPFMSILMPTGIDKAIKRNEVAEHPDLLHLPFPDPSYSILKHLFFKEDGLEVTVGHKHPLILNDITSSRITYHDPMKRIELLCNGCLRPITSGPIYVCANEEEEHCNFVLHKWCSRLPTELKDHPHHPENTLILQSKIPGKFFEVFYCDICNLPCNGFAYCCITCAYYIDIHCAFLPKEITHNSHPNHLLLRDNNQTYRRCNICYSLIWRDQFSFSCHICDDFVLHVECALFIYKTTTHKCDKHPMELSYFPVENHKSEYFCEICENEFDPEFPFFHCHKCMQSMHPACAPSILMYETHTTSGFYRDNAIYKFVNVKFGGIYNNIKVHQHPLSFVQGIANDGPCDKCGHGLQKEMIFKCLDCKFAVDITCCESLSK